MLTDLELVRAAQRGDSVSLGILFERHRAPLYALALSMLGHGPDAQDAVHDSFLIALRNIDRLREPEAVGAWLRGIVRNVCLRRLSRGRTEKTLFAELPRYAEKGPSESSAEEVIDRLALRDWVWTALSELPEALRVTAMLRYFGNYTSYEEIAAILGIPVGTVRSRLNRIKAKLADALLKTAELEHDEARRLTESQTRYWGAAWDEFNRGQGYELFASAFSSDPVWILADGAIHRGRGWVIEEAEGDLETGTRLHLTNIVVSKDVIVMENDYENPPDDPFRCPPAISWVGFYRGEEIHRTHLYFAPRRGGEER